MLLGLADQPAGVFQAGLGIVDGAGADDDQQPVVHAVHDGADLIAAAFDDVRHPGVQRQLGDELRGRGQRVNSLTRRLDVDFAGVAVAGLMFGVLFQIGSGPRSEPAGEMAKGRE